MNKPPDPRDGQPGHHTAGMAGLASSKETMCPHCFSTKVRIVDSYETRDVMVIRCLNCGKQSEMDTENNNTNIGTLVPPTPSADPS